MKNFTFSLQINETGPLVKGNSPAHLNLSIQGQHPIKQVGDQVLAGEKLGEANRPESGDLHAPLAGTVISITDFTLCIEVTGEDRAPTTQPPKEDGLPLKQWLSSNGVATGYLQKATTLIVNAVPPEPGISIFEPLLRDYRQTVEIGIETVKRIVNPAQTFLVTAKGNQTNAFPHCTVVHVAPTYPNGIDALVIKKVTGQEVLPGTCPDNAVLTTIRDLYFIGKVMETGRPLTETVMTIGTQNALVPIGTPIGFLAQEAGHAPQPGDRLVCGGIMRGMAAKDLAQGVEKHTTGLTILTTGNASTPADNFCLGCGECVRHCPSRIMPGMISRCAEFKEFKRAEQYHIHSCIECGLCGYWCKAQRPILQYIRFAKYELALMQDAVDATSTTPDEEA